MKSKDGNFGLRPADHFPRFFRMLPVLLLPVVVLVLTAAPESWAEGKGKFDVSELFFELNDTDGDLGIHGLIDGEAWKRLEIEDPRGRQMLDVLVQGRLRRQGLTELFFESAEPTFDELAPEDFFRRFPEGKYGIEGITLEGEELESTAILTHLLPAPPENIMVNGMAVPEDCDEGPVPEVSGPVTFSWGAVTKSHPEIGKTGKPIKVVRYQVVVEQEELGLVFSVDLPPDVTFTDVPATFIALGDEFKLEILVRESSGNQTAVETCFAIGQSDL